MSGIRITTGSVNRRRRRHRYERRIFPPPHCAQSARGRFAFFRRRPRTSPRPPRRRPSSPSPRPGSPRAPPRPLPHPPASCPVGGALALHRAPFCALDRLPRRGRLGKRVGLLAEGGELLVA